MKNYYPQNKLKNLHTIYLILKSQVVATFFLPTSSPFFWYAQFDPQSFVYIFRVSIFFFSAMFDYLICCWLFLFFPLICHLLRVQCFCFIFFFLSCSVFPFSPFLCHVWCFRFLLFFVVFSYRLFSLLFAPHSAISNFIFHSMLFSCFLFSTWYLGLVSILKMYTRNSLPTLISLELYILLSPQRKSSNSIFNCTNTWIQYEH